MSAGRLDINIEQGATFERTFTISDDGVPFDLTGYSAKFQIRANLADDGELVNVPGADPGATMFISAPATGQILVSLAPSVTQTLPVADPTRLGPQDSGVWSLEITSNVGVVTRLLEGVVNISPRVIFE